MNKYNYSPSQVLEKYKALGRKYANGTLNSNKRNAPKKEIGTVDALGNATIEPTIQTTTPTPTPISPNVADASYNTRLDYYNQQKNSTLQSLNDLLTSKYGAGNYDINLGYYQNGASAQDSWNDEKDELNLARYNKLNTDLANYESTIADYTTTRNEEKANASQLAAMNELQDKYGQKYLDLKGLGSGGLAEASQIARSNNYANNVNANANAFQSKYAQAYENLLNANKSSQANLDNEITNINKTNKANSVAEQTSLYTSMLTQAQNYEDLMNLYNSGDFEDVKDKPTQKYQFELAKKSLMQNELSGATTAQEIRDIYSKYGYTSEAYTQQMQDNVAKLETPYSTGSNKYNITASTDQANWSADKTSGVMNKNIMITLNGNTYEVELGNPNLSAYADITLGDEDKWRANNAVRIKNLKVGEILRSEIGGRTFTFIKHPNGNIYPLESAGRSAGQLKALENALGLYGAENRKKSVSELEFENKGI